MQRLKIIRLHRSDGDCSSFLSEIILITYKIYMVFRPGRFSLLLNNDILWSGINEIKLHVLLLLLVVMCVFPKKILIKLVLGCF